LLTAAVLGLAFSGGVACKNADTVSTDAGFGNPPCAVALRTCNGGCIDARFDPFNCGDCGKPCAAGEVCCSGQCGLTCVGGPKWA